MDDPQTSLLALKLNLLWGLAGFGALWAKVKGYQFWIWFFGHVVFGINFVLIPLISVGLLKDQRQIAKKTGTGPDPELVYKGNTLATRYIAIGLLLQVIIFVFQVAVEVIARSRQ